MIPKIEMKIPYKGKVITEDVDFELANRLKDDTFELSNGRFFTFDYEDYLWKLGQTRWAEAWITIHKGLNGTYEEAKDGSVFPEEEDMNWFYNEFLTLYE